MTEFSKDDVRAGVRNAYAAVARGKTGGGCCGPAAGDGGAAACCAPPASGARARSTGLGYSEADLGAVPEDSNMGLGCGNPTAVAALKPGETVVDLGAGGGFDCFLAARQVGPEGRVIGVDMTPDMVSLARRNAANHGYDNVDFRLGEIEYLPVADGTVDVILSNCVVNLSPDKPAVFAEAFRVLKSGGRLSISDVVATAPIPDELAGSMASISACIGGAAPVGEIVGWLEAAGFEDVRVTVDEKSRATIAEWAPGTGPERYVASAMIEARKP